MGVTGGHHHDPLARGEPAVDDPDVRDDAAVGVVDRVEDHRPGRRVRIADRRGDLLDDHVEQLLDALAGLARGPQHVLGPAADQVRQLVGVLLRLGGRQVDLVQHGDDREVVLHGQVQVGERLRLDALRGVDQQHGALAGGQRAGHLVGEVDVTGVSIMFRMCVVPVPSPTRGVHGSRTAWRLDRDAALALDVHPVEVLGAHLAVLHHAGLLQHPVGQRRLAVVDVGDDAEVPDQRRVGGAGLGNRGHAGVPLVRRVGVERAAEWRRPTSSHAVNRVAASEAACGRCVDACDVPGAVPRDRRAAAVVAAAPAVRGAVERELGAPVAAAESCGGGFTAGFASRVLTSDGGRAFIKAESGMLNPVIADCYRREAVVNAALPVGVRAPRVRWTIEVDDWVVLGFDDVAGRMPEWPRDLDAVLELASDLVSLLTPAPVGWSWRRWPRRSNSHIGDVRRAGSRGLVTGECGPGDGRPALAGAAGGGGGFGVDGGAARLAEVDGWAERHLDLLADAGGWLGRGGRRLDDDPRRSAGGQHAGRRGRHGLALRLELAVPGGAVGGSGDAAAQRARGRTRRGRGARPGTRSGGTPIRRR